MNKGENSTINFSKLLQLSLDLDSVVKERFPSIILFLTNNQGQILSMRKVGSYTPDLVELVSMLPEKITANKFPLKENDFFVDAISIQLQQMDEEWHGYFGAVLCGNEGNAEVLRSFILGCKQSLIMAAKLLNFENSDDVNNKNKNDIVNIPIIESNNSREISSCLEKIIKEQKSKDLLLKVTKKFHSSMDVSAILAEIIVALKEIFPVFEINILLSHEWEVSKDLPVKQLSYEKGKTNEGATNAYLTGKIQIEDIIKERKSVVYAPLRGKQGVYGVLKIIARNSFVFPQHEIDFIEVLADTGGNAIENAELYQQSRQLVEDLKLINSTSHQLNSNLRLAETINYMTEQIKTSFSAQEIGFFMFRPNGDIEVIEGSTSFFIQDSSKDGITAFCEQIKKDKDAIFTGDLSKSDQYYLKPFRSFIAVPMVQSGELKGAVMIVHEQAYYFSFHKFKLLQSLIHHSTLAFTNSRLHEELEKLVVTDHLTRLYARNYLDEKIVESMQKDAFGCFILIDIDNFKQINDIYGHQVGDDIIIQVANILKKNIKSSDIAARWGGEELAVYLPKVDQEVGTSVAERIREKVLKETSPRVTISCGVSKWQQIDTNKSLKLLFNQADQALYTAKRNGKNIVVVFDENTCYL